MEIISDSSRGRIIPYPDRLDAVPPPRTTRRSIAGNRRVIMAASMGLLNACLIIY